MEFGAPTLYAEVNRVIREFDTSQIVELGPFIRILSYVSSHAEKNRANEDKISTGNVTGESYNNFSGSFLLFRGS